MADVDKPLAGITVVELGLLLTALWLLPETHGRDLAVMSEPVRA
jgi:hypothetical protein